VPSRPASGGSGVSYTYPAVRIFTINDACMTLADAKKLIENNRLKTVMPQNWADLGSGNGLFSKALLSLLPGKSVVYATDKQPFTFPGTAIQFLEKDFEKDELSLPLLDGILMANSLHFVKNKLVFLKEIKKHLLPAAVFLLVEYDIETPNRWVPYPLSYSSAESLFKQAGFDSIEKINERRSVYNSAKIYSACVYNTAHN
jgi:SAM-dependent methyltransferase